MSDSRVEDLSVSVPDIECALRLSGREYAFYSHLQLLTWFPSHVEGMRHPSDVWLEFTYVTFSL